ncbi:MAG: PDZ domain-containing protein [Candidatus Hydrogenedentes bacterium]|nr:PDZ domain-containing protein [Candidatus Hydrogenedentota bacterium]
MRVIVPLRVGVAALALTVLAANVASGGEAAPAPAPKMVMKTIRADQAQTLADGLEASLVTMKVSGKQPQVVVRLRDASNDLFLKWAELKEGDVLVSVNGTPIQMRDEVVKAAKELKPGKTLQMDLTRQGKSVVLRIRIGDGASEAPVATPSPKSESKKSNDGAIVVNAEQMERELEALDPVTLMLQAAPQMVEDANGRIIGITSDNLGGIPLAGKVGLMSGDVIQSVNGIPITSEASIFELADRLQGQKQFEARVLRNGKPMVLHVVAE